MTDAFDWAKYERYFSCDGSLSDIFVLGTNLDDWERLFAFLRTYQYELAYKVDGDEVPFPESTRDAFKRTSTSTCALKFDIGGILVCGIPRLEEIELDI